MQPTEHPFDSDENGDDALFL